MRAAPSLAIVQALEDAGARVRAFDPEGMEIARDLMPGVTFCADAYDAATAAAVVAIVTEWDVFLALDLDRLADLMAAPVLVDLRNVYSPADTARTPFTSHFIGGCHRPPPSQARSYRSSNSHMYPAPS